MAIWAGQRFRYPRSHQRKQTSINYASSNRNYANRIMITHSTGLNKKGWAFSISGSRRWADEGYSDGTYYDGWSFFSCRQAFQRPSPGFFRRLCHPNREWPPGASVQEMVDLAGNIFYNPYWGYQNGKNAMPALPGHFSRSASLPTTGK